MQNTTNVLMIKQSRMTAETPYLPTVAVAVTELFKLVVCCCVIFWDRGEDGGHRSLGGLLRVVRAYTVDAPCDALKVAVPAFIYTIQNNLLYVAVQNLSPGVFQCTYQLKILTTAVFSVVMLGRKLSGVKVGALFVLLLGVVCVQLKPEDLARILGTAGADAAEAAAAETDEAGRRLLLGGGRELGQQVVARPMVGLAAALTATCTSAFAGVYFEKILKRTKASLWIRNIQLGLFGFLIGVAGVYAKDGAAVRDPARGGLFQGFTPLVWGVVLVQGAGGLLVAVVVKYADNILKGFATSVAIILSAVASIYLFGFEITNIFSVGTALVITSVFMYGNDKLVKDKCAAACGRGNQSARGYEMVSQQQA